MSDSKPYLYPVEDLGYQYPNEIRGVNTTTVCPKTRTTKANNIKTLLASHQSYSSSLPLSLTSLLFFRLSFSCSSSILKPAPKVPNLFARPAPHPHGLLVSRHPVLHPDALLILVVLSFVPIASLILSSCPSS